MREKERDIDIGRETEATKDRQTETTMERKQNDAQNCF